MCSINTVYLPTDESTVIAAVPPTDSTANHQTQCTINKSTIGPAVESAFHSTNHPTIYATVCSTHKATISTTITTPFHAAIDTTVMSAHNAAFDTTLSTA